MSSIANSESANTGNSERVHIPLCSIHSVHPSIHPASISEQFNYALLKFSILLSCCDQKIRKQELIISLSRCTDARFTEPVNLTELKFCNDISRKPFDQFQPFCIICHL